MKSISPYIIVSRDDTHKQQVTLENTNITLQLITKYQENKRTRDPEICTIIGTYSDDYPVGMKLYVTYLAFAEWNEIYIPETQKTIFKIPIDCAMFEVKDDTLLPLKGFCLGIHVRNPDRYHNLTPDIYKNEPLKDVAEIIAVHSTTEEIKIGDVVKTNKYGCGYTMELNRKTYIKVRFTDIEAIINDYKQIR